jgi:hypothetical protein
LSELRLTQWHIFIISRKGKTWETWNHAVTHCIGPDDNSMTGVLRSRMVGQKYSLCDFASEKSQGNKGETIFQGVKEEELQESRESQETWRNRNATQSSPQL